MIRIPPEKPVTEYLHNKAARLGLPLNGTFELTPVCNMACRMCYVRMTAEEQRAIRPLHTAEEWIELGKTARDKGMLYLLLTGGEPFLRPDFREILSELHRLGLIISINSNGTLIDEKTVEWLVKTPPVRINLTLYGASDETYARLCANPHGFTQATRAIHLLQEAGIVVKLNHSSTPWNVDDLPAIFRFAEENGLVMQATDYMFPPLRRDTSMVGVNERFSPEDAAYYMARINCLYNGEEDFLRRMEEQGPGALAGDTGEDCTDTEGDGVQCRAGKCSFWVTWDGVLQPCGMLPPEGMLNVFDAGFDAAWAHAREFVQSIRLPVKCKSCALKDDCRACAAMVYTESGCFDKVPEYRCRMSHEYGPACERLVREIKERRNNI